MWGSLSDVIMNDYGLDLNGWSLWETTGVSADGCTIVGNGTNPSGYAEGWIAVLSEPLTPLPGDFNGDGTVGAADYTMWQGSLGSMTDLAADGDASGTVGAGDYAVWKANFGQTAGPGSSAFDNAAVPEPATMVLLMFALAC